MNAELTALVRFLQGQGFRVFTPKKPSTYCFFTDATGIPVAYAQVNRLEGWTFTTVHCANGSSGTGYRVNSPLDALTVSLPTWAASDILPKKHDSMEAFRAKNWQALEEVPHV